MKRRIIGALLVGLAASITVAIFMMEAPAPKAELVRERESLNRVILEVLKDYPTDGSYERLPGSMVAKSCGTTRDLYYQGTRVVEGDPEKRSYCSGIVFEVYIRACENHAKQLSGSTGFTLAGLDVKGFQAMRRDFYGVNGNPRTFADGLVQRGLALPVSTFDQALPGDLVQFWRFNGTGHSVVFLDWVSDSSGQKTGIHYWSVQQATGIAEARESIGTRRNDVDIERIYIVRALAPNVP